MNQHFLLLLSRWSVTLAGMALSVYFEFKVFARQVSVIYIAFKYCNSPSATFVLCSFSNTNNRRELLSVSRKGTRRDEKARSNEVMTERTGILRHKSDPLLKGNCFLAVKTILFANMSLASGNVPTQFRM